MTQTTADAAGHLLGTAPVPTDGRGLLVYVPSLGHRTQRSAALLGRLAEDLGDQWRVVRWDHGLTPLSGQRMEDVAHRLAVQIRTWAGDNGVGQPVDRVLLVGHSVGGLLVRHAYLLDAGLTGGQPQAAYPWTGKVERIVLLAAANAGFVTHRLKPWLRLPYAVAAGIGRLTAEQLQAGSPYITELRLRWVDAFRRDPTIRRPTVVQVLGDRDDIVSRDDSLDVEYMRDAMRIDVPNARHGDLVDIGSAPDRYRLLRHATFGALDQRRLPEVPPSTAPVYMLLHGIRAGRYSNWVEELSTALRHAHRCDAEASKARANTEVDDEGDARSEGDASTKGKDDRRRGDVVIYAPSYGYFSAVEFALPTTRSRNLRHLLDWYSRLHATHSGGVRCFAGHSNGTYLLGRALEGVPAIHFDRVYLAGSVLPREFPWSQIVRRGQIGQKVHNDRAARDVPVGWLCSALRGLGMRDVGTAGVDGFDDRPPEVFEHHHALPGGHGVALRSRRIPHAVAFLHDGVDGRDPPAASALASWAFSFAGRLIGVTALPAAVGAGAYTVRWVLSDTDRSRLAALGAGAAVLWGIGRAV